MITTSHNAGENRSHSLCTISVNVDCRDEFVVCYGVHAMSRELNFLTCGLEALGSQTFLIVYGIIDGKSRALFPETAKSGFTDRRICSEKLSRSWKDFAVRNGKFVLTVNSIKTSRTRAKTWLILLGKQFRSVTQPHDESDTESRRSGVNLASLQTGSHSVSQAITFTSSLTERFDFLSNSNSNSCSELKLMRSKSNTNLGIKKLLIQCHFEATIKKTGSEARPMKFRIFSQLCIHEWLTEPFDYTVTTTWAYYNAIDQAAVYIYTHSAPRIRTNPALPKVLQKPTSPTRNNQYDIFPLFRIGMMVISASLQNYSPLDQMRKRIVPAACWHNSQTCRSP